MINNTAEQIIYSGVISNLLKEYEAQHKAHPSSIINVATTFKKDNKNFILSLTEKPNDSSISFTAKDGTVNHISGDFKQTKEEK